jgi:hypothetical protein
MEVAVVIAGVSVAALAAVLVLAGNINALRGTPRSRWLSFAGGVAVAYVFLQLLPELTRAQQNTAEQHGRGPWLREHLLFLVSLAGAATLFGIERAAKRTKQTRKERGAEERAAAWVFWLHAALMSVYVAFIAYLLFDRERPAEVAVLGLVMALHFSGIAVALADDYRSLYSTRGRWLLAAAVLAGGIYSYLATLPETVHHLVLSVLAGAVIFSVIKEEIPPEQQSRFWAVAAGIAVAATLLWTAG